MSYSTDEEVLGILLGLEIPAEEKYRDCFQISRSYRSTS